MSRKCNSVFISLSSLQVRCINHEEEVITVRVQLDEKTSLINTLAADLMNDSDMSESTPLSTSLSDSLVSGECKACKHQLFEPVRLGRVLPLPSVDWEQASEDWFCHIHKEDGQRLKPTSLHPEKDECFYTELFFLFHHSVIKQTKAEGPSDRLDINCIKCNLPLGVLGHQSAKLWIHNLVLKNEDESVVHSTDVSTIMLSLFHNLEKDTFGVNCRLVLHLQTLPKKYLYMVTMNTNQKLLISKDSELLHSGVNRKERQLETDFTKECLGAKRARESGQPEVRLQAVFGVKLLFAVKEGDDNETGEWADSVHVHLIPCSDIFFSEVKALLEASNSCLPENIKFIENMRLGYIIKQQFVSQKLAETL